MSQENPSTFDYPGYPTLAARLASFDLAATNSESTQKRFAKHPWLAGSAFLTPPVAAASADAYVLSRFSHGNVTARFPLQPGRT